ncbi:hypothetical protein [Paenisporosarcina sp. OV554]|nr:hypothetical protein [Paenisporosarcina sp. OV554]
MKSKNFLIGQRAFHDLGLFGSMVAILPGTRVMSTYGVSYTTGFSD